MLERLRFLTVGLMALFAAQAAVRSGEACGALVTEEKALVVQSQQRVLISLLGDGTSHIVVQLGIPDASAPFGALTPVSALPTLDPTPIDTEELDELDELTRPVVHVATGDGGDSGCDCAWGRGKDSDSGGGGDGDGVGVGVVEVVDIGPVTAAVLSADTSADLLTWLGDNGFVLPATEEKTLDAYVGDGKYFIAFKRSKQAEDSESSVGISFSVPGDQRGYPLRMSRIGAAKELGIQVFVAAPKKVAPRGSAPIGNFATLTLSDLSGDLVADYTGAVRAAVARHDGKAFVVETVFDDEYGWHDGLSKNLSAVTEPGQVLTRLVTVVKSSDLTEDVSFTGDAPEDVSLYRHATRMVPKGTGHVALFGAAMIGLTVRRGRRERRSGS